MNSIRFGLAASLCLIVSGCGLFGAGQGPSRARTLQSDAFLRGTSDEAQQQVDRSGAMPPSVYRGEAAPIGTADLPPEKPPITGISEAVKDVVSTPQPSTTIATSQPLVGTTGGFVTIGAVVTEVSGSPIYADKVIQRLAPMLSAEAKQRDIQSYRAVASKAIEEQVRVMVSNEVEYTLAMKNLDQQEKDFAWNYTMNWRARQITEAGGSEELARRKALAEGTTFEEKVSEFHRETLRQVFYDRKIRHKTQITADDLRKYYERNLKTQFSEVDQAQFRMIKITPQAMGGREQAIDKIKGLREQAARGDDFEKLASGINHDANLMRNGGRVGGEEGWIQRGAFALTEVEEAVWKLQPGEVTEVIEVNGAFYIAKLEQRTLGRVRAFEDEDVQRQIRNTLERQQLARRREQEQERLMKESVVYPWPPVTAPALEIAMQKYSQWSQASP